ncbi:hypothetical protein OG884_28890 [Streptosporangium sp. NBC_01755]|nr:hypothetical protein [Streptosporangium sp. NBC_01755]WSC98844.1 hypothetical protein OG884_28890 [Streptosporangium sp. NBC_01755]
MAAPVEAASAADVAIVVASTTPEVESSGRSVADRRLSATVTV